MDILPKLIREEVVFQFNEISNRSMVCRFPVKLDREASRLAKHIYKIEQQGICHEEIKIYGITDYLCDPPYRMQNQG